MAKAKTNETIDKAMELTQDAATATLEVTVKTAEVTEDYVQGMYKVGYDTNMEAMKVAKGYWDTTSKIRQDWIKLFETTGKNLINATANMEVPTVNEVTDFGKDVYKNVTKTVKNLTPQTKTATK